MREIKVRGWFSHPSDPTKSKWVYGFFYIDSADNYWIKRGVNSWRIVRGSEGQFIGLPDKNKKDIYEGDICKVINPNDDRDEDCIVEYNVNGYIYEPEDGYGDFDLSSIGWAMDMGYSFEIIGNIHKEASE